MWWSLSALWQHSPECCDYRGGGKHTTLCSSSLSFCSEVTSATSAYLIGQSRCHSPVQLREWYFVYRTRQKLRISENNPQNLLKVTSCFLCVCGCLVDILFSVQHWIKKGKEQALKPLCPLHKLLDIDMTLFSFLGRIHGLSQEYFIAYRQLKATCKLNCDFWLFFLSNLLLKAHYWRLPFLRLSP